MLRPTDAEAPAKAPLFAASIRPGPPPEMTAKPASESLRASVSVSLYQRCSGLMRALPKIETAGRMSASASVASTNSAIMPSTCQDSLALMAVDRSLGIMLLSLGVLGIAFRMFLTMGPGFFLLLFSPYRAVPEAGVAVFAGSERIRLRPCGRL
jgi:hypothetical protein